MPISHIRAVPGQQCSQLDASEWTCHPCWVPWRALHMPQLYHHSPPSHTHTHTEITSHQSGLATHVGSRDEHHTCLSSTTTHLLHTHTQRSCHIRVDLPLMLGPVTSTTHASALPPLTSFTDTHTHTQTEIMSVCVLFICETCSKPIHVKS